MDRPRIALVSRELHPFAGGGIAPIVRATAEVLAPVADVTLLTTALHRDAYAELTRGGPLYPPGVRVVFVEEPPEREAQPGHYYTWLQAWSARVFGALLDAYPDGGPDYVEFPDYCAEGFVTLQAKRTAEPALRDTLIGVRTHTTAELVAILDQHLDDGLEAAAVCEMERYCLRHADRLVWPGGDVLETYRRYYGADRLAPAVRIPDAFLRQPELEVDARAAKSGPLRLLFLGRLERRKGVQNLIRALLTSDVEDWHLSLVGGDTPTGPLGASMRRQGRLMTHGDDRVALLDPVPREQVGRLIAAHDAVVMPSLWECWPNVAREALLHDRPVIATPVGGLVDLVRPGVSGWLARDTSLEAVRELLEQLAGDPAQVRALAASGGPRRVLEELTDPDMIRARYLQLVDDRPAPPPPRRRRPAPLVSVIVPYHRMHRFVTDTLDSVAEQTHPRVETVLVDDGSLGEEDRILEQLAERDGVRLVTQPNRGLGAARNFGIRNSFGRYVLPLDADDLIAPDFVERCLHALEADPDLAYVGTWSRYVDEDLAPLEGAEPGYTPLGNWSALTERQNVAGSASALLRRNLFDTGFAYSHELTSYEDWLLYLQLRRAGRYGAIIPRPLLTYRIRGSSMLRATGTVRWDRLRGEVAALLAEGEMPWTSASA